MSRHWARTQLAMSAFAAVAAVSACSVDDRALLAGDGRAGASGAGFGSSAFGGGGAQNTMVNVAPVPLPDCDFGAAGDSGCETLVVNPGFATDATGWAPEEGSISMSWDADDATGKKDSGSLSVINSLSGAADGIAAQGASQCLPTSAGQAYGFAADVYIPGDQGSGLDGGSYQASAGMSIIFYGMPGCAGYSAKNATSDLSQEAGSWAHREGRALAPDGAHSMSVRLVTLKNFREFTFQARFDNVLVKAE